MLSATDWNEPDFDMTEKCHDWKNYASEDLISIWNELSPSHKMVIAECLQVIADAEEWD